MVKDHIRLAEPLSCLKCQSTIDDFVGSHEEKSTYHTPFGELKVIRMHDGRGGLKEFQTADFAQAAVNYRFPGFAPVEDYGSGDAYFSSILGFPKQKNIRFQASGVEICNVCEAMYGALFHLRKEGDIYLFEEVVIHPDEESDAEELFWKIGNEEFAAYSLRAEREGIRLVPKLEAVDYYTQKAKEHQERASHLKHMLSLIDEDYIPRQQLLADLDTRIQYLGEKEIHQNKLAASVQLLDQGEHISTCSEGALKAAVVILYQKNKQRALDIIESANIDSSDNFEESYQFLYGWFFGGEKGWGSLAGAWGGGANSFLHGLKEKH